MENSPITLAHNHARSALIETRRSNPVAASEEHDLAATEFAAAAQGTTNSEAQRVLLLLEQHHKKLGQILKSRHENASQGLQVAEPQDAALPITSKAAEAAATHLRATSPEANPVIPKLSQNFKPSHRESSNSIASNLASARGIPGPQQRRDSPASPTLSAQHASGKLVGAAVGTRASDQPGKVLNNTVGLPGREQKASPETQGSSTIVDNRAPEPSAMPSSDLRSHQIAAGDAPFQQFYNTFETLISKLSAPLAFAGLPLSSAPISTRADSEPPPVAKKELPSKRPSAQPDPQSGGDVDYSQLISRAALRAIRDGIAQTSVAESFYVVPTTGGTVSYAGILNREQKEAGRHQRQLSNISEDADDFVDARETIPTSPELTRLDAAPAPLRGRLSRQSTSGSTASRKATPASKSSPASGSNNKTMEELTLENQALKHLADNLSKRVHMWEVNAQSSSAALQQSLRSLQSHAPRAVSPASTTRSDSGKGQSLRAPPLTGLLEEPSPGSTEKQRIDELEEIIRKMERERGKQERENEKLKNVVGRYRERWEKLKEGAKSRREGSAATGSGGAGLRGTSIGNGNDDGQMTTEKADRGVEGEDDKKE